MKSSVAEKEYAKALFMLAERTDRIDRIAEDYGTVVEVLEKHKRLKHIMMTPQVSAEDKQKLLKAGFTGKVDEYMLKFLLVLIRKYRQDLLIGVYHAYLQLVNEHYNRLEVSTVSAVELSQSERAALSANLSAHFKREIILQPSVDPALLGGMVCRVGDVVYDGSLRSKLNRLSQLLTKK